MTLPRRHFLHLAAGATAFSAASRIARAQVYPSRPVRIIVGAPPGGGHDIAARLIAPRLEDRLGQSFFIDNRPGANTNIGAQAAAKATPDGYTLLLLGATHAMNMEFYGKLAVDITRDIVPVAALSRLAFVCRPSVGPGQDSSRIHFLCKSQSGQAEHGIWGHFGTAVWRTV
jgi:tripartite-type tricarboxylate transporter receptor subunit TctC